MTLEQFDKTEFHKGMKVRVLRGDDGLWTVMIVDFNRRELIIRRPLRYGDPNDITTIDVGCDEIELIPEVTP